jgi:predicted NBD/HSP70 family sugar kinase
MSKLVGVDLGGTWLRAARIGAGGRDRSIGRAEKQPAPSDWDTFVEALARFNEHEVDGFGVALSGPIAGHAQVISGPNLPWLDGRNVREELESALGKRVVISNDMEAATEGEMAYGVLRRFKWAAFQTISTGWGGNLILNGVRVDSEPGHANVTFNSQYRCGSGHIGCREALYSGTGMARRIDEALRAAGGTAQPSSELWAIFHRAVGSSNDWALALLDDWAEGVGRAWANLLNEIRPLQAIVYMGMTAESLIPLPRVQERLRETMRRICMYPEHRTPSFPILRAEEENRALFGAAIVYKKVL